MAVRFCRTAFFVYLCIMKRMITILGPTASGKTPVAAHLALEIGGEIISADSRHDAKVNKKSRPTKSDGHYFQYKL